MRHVMMTRLSTHALMGSSLAATLVIVAAGAAPIASAQTRASSAGTTNAPQLAVTGSTSPRNNGSAVNNGVATNGAGTVTGNSSGNGAAINNGFATNSSDGAAIGRSNSAGAATTNQATSLSGTNGVTGRSLGAAISGANSGGATGAGASASNFATAPMTCLEPQELDLCLSEEGFTR